MEGNNILLRVYDITDYDAQQSNIRICIGDWRNIIDDGRLLMEKIEREGILYAIVVRKGSLKDEFNFVTPEDFPFQLGVQNKEKGSEFQPHKHKPFNKVDLKCQEFFYVVSGKMMIDMYDNNDIYFKSFILNEGDFAIINEGGHGGKFLEKTQLIEIKQGPYRGKDKEKVMLG